MTQYSAITVQRVINALQVCNAQVESNQHNQQMNFLTSMLEESTVMLM